MTEGIIIVSVQLLMKAINHKAGFSIVLLICQEHVLTWKTHLQPTRFEMYMVE